MKKCKITVLKTLFNEDLISVYGAKGIGKFPLHTVGQALMPQNTVPLWALHTTKMTSSSI